MFRFGLTLESGFGACWDRGFGTWTRAWQFWILIKLRDPSSFSQTLLNSLKTVKWNSFWENLITFIIVIFVIWENSYIVSSELSRFISFCYHCRIYSILYQTWKVSKTIKHLNVTWERKGQTRPGFNNTKLRYKSMIGFSLKLSFKNHY